MIGFKLSTKRGRDGRRASGEETGGLVQEIQTANESGELTDFGAEDADEIEWNSLILLA